MQQYTIKNENYAKRKSNFVRNLIWTVSGIVAAAILIFFLVFFISRYSKNHVSAKTLKTYWNSSDEEKYLNIYNDGKSLLQKDPFNNTVLVYYGYSCFYLAVGQTDSSAMQKYLEEAINSLRLALYNAKEGTKPQIYYMLGKSYFYMNKISPNFYADLTIENLNNALHSGYEAHDIYEYLGMSYAALDMTTESIAAFSEALLVRESYNLLVSIAEQYKKNGQKLLSKQYLFRVISECQDEALIERCHILLGNILLEEEAYEEARKEFEEVLKINQNSGDANYGIGVIYEKEGNIAKARAQWRTALKLQANHQGALNKLSETKK